MNKRTNDDDDDDENRIENRKSNSTEIISNEIK